MSQTLDNKNCRKNYIKSLCAKLFLIFSNIYFDYKYFNNIFFCIFLILNYIKSPCKIFYAKMFQHSQIVYTLKALPSKK